MPDIEKRRAQWREYAKARREARKAAGLPSESGPKGQGSKSGGKATQAERSRRYRERKREQGEKRE